MGVLVEKPTESFARIRHCLEVPLRLRKRTFWQVGSKELTGASGIGFSPSLFSQLEADLRVWGESAREILTF